MKRLLNCGRFHKYSILKLLCFICVAALLCVTPKFSRHIFTELRCTHETLQVNRSVILHSDSQPELVDQFKRIYDVELRGGDDGDALDIYAAAGQDIRPHLLDG